MRKFIGNFLIILSILAFIGAGVFLLDKLKDYKVANETYEELEKEATHKKKKEFTVDWEKLKGTDVIAWIRFGDKISYPIVQGKNNSYYLHKLYNKKYSYAGSIFANYDNSKYFTDPNTIIYGHNMRNGSMFGTLKKWKDKDQTPKKFYIYLPDGTRHTYKLFSVANVKDTGDAYYYSFATLEDYEKYQKYMKRRSLYDTGVDVDTNARLFSLSTCAQYGSAKGNRVMVQGMETSVKQVQEPASWYKPSQEPDQLQELHQLYEQQQLQEQMQREQQLQEQQMQQQIQQQQEQIQQQQIQEQQIQQ